MECFTTKLVVKLVTGAWSVSTAVTWSRFDDRISVHRHFERPSICPLDWWWSRILTAPMLAVQWKKNSTIYDCRDGDGNDSAAC